MCIVEKPRLNSSTSAQFLGTSSRERWGRIRREFRDLFHGVLGTVRNDPAKMIDHVTLAQIIKALAEYPSLRRTVARLISDEHPIGGRAGEADSSRAESDAVTRWLTAIANDRDLRFFVTEGELLDEKAVVRVSPAMLRRRGLCASLAAALCVEDVAAAFGVVLSAPLNANPKPIIADARKCGIIDEAFQKLEAAASTSTFETITAFVASLCSIRQARAAFSLLIGPGKVTPAKHHLWRVRGSRIKAGERCGFVGNIFTATPDKLTPPNVHAALEAACPGHSWRKPPTTTYYGEIESSFSEDEVPDEWLPVIKDAEVAAWKKGVAL